MDAGPRLLASSRTSVFVKVAEGCNKACAFCTIPSIRGRFVSRAPELVLDEISALVSCGAKEIILVSQDTANYGRDIGSNLARLVDRIGELPLDDFWLRVHYLYPSQVSEELIDAIARNPFAVPYFDVPVQHASPAVLRAMNRPPSPEKMQKTFERIRATFPESAIRTTVITGHPGETRAEFDRLLDFIEEVEFDRLGVFPFSPETGTPARDMKRPRGAESRAREVMELQERISAKRLSARVGKTYDVLMDSAEVGRTMFEAPDVDGVVHATGRAGDSVSARITSSDAHDLYAA